MKQKEFLEVTLTNEYTKQFVLPNCEHKLYEDSLQNTLQKTKDNLERFINQYPHVSTDNVYTLENNKLWTASFFPGMTYLAYEITQDENYLKNSESYLDSFLDRLENGHTQTHDIGFLYTLTCVANYS